MGLLVMMHARLSHGEKFVAISIICAYPKHESVLCPDEDLRNGSAHRRKNTVVIPELISQMPLRDRMVGRSRYRENVQTGIFVWPIAAP